MAIDIATETESTETQNIISIHSGRKDLSPILKADQIRVFQKARVQQNKLGTYKYQTLLLDAVQLEELKKSCGIDLYDSPEILLKNVSDDKSFNCLNPDRTFARLVRGLHGEVTLFLTNTPKKYWAQRLYRTFPIIGGDNLQGIINGDRQFDEDSMWKEVFYDPVLEKIRNSRILVVGGGTLAGAYMEALAALGVMNVDFLELPDETFEKHNISRYPGATSLNEGAPKYLSILLNYIENMPFANIKYWGAYSDTDAMSGHINNWWDEAGDSGAMRLVLLALDNAELRLHLLDEINQLPEGKAMVAADLAFGSHVRIVEPGKSLEREIETMRAAYDANGPTAMAIAEHGGLPNVLYNFNSSLVSAALSGKFPFFAQMLQGAQSSAAALTIQLVSMASGGNTYNSYMIDPEKNAQGGRIKMVINNIVSILNAQKKRKNNVIKEA